jgi:hypothetical protein
MASAERTEGFFEEIAEAFSAVPHGCDDGSTVQATLQIRTQRFIEFPDNEDPNPTARLLFQALCSGSSFTWGAVASATIASILNLKSVTASGEVVATDSRGMTHDVSFDVAWTGVGSLETVVNAPGSQTKIREATATGLVTFDGALIVDGHNNHPTRPSPFIRNDIEK